MQNLNFFVEKKIKISVIYHYLMKLCKNHLHQVLQQKIIYLTFELYTIEKNLTESIMKRSQTQNYILAPFLAFFTRCLHTLLSKDKIQRKSDGK